MADLCSFPGIGQAKAVKIAAAMELGRRRSHQVIRPPRTISSSKEVFDLMRSRLGDLGHEEFWCIYLNNANRVLSERQLSKGGITGTMVDVRLVYQAALQMGSVAVILVHNHPSGTLRPSEADKRLTAKLQQGGSQLDIQVLDHVIITEKAYFSFADEHLL
jgi:DNA repair protein RadC